MAQRYELKSDLARVCLRNTQGNPERVLAWVNSICCLFLIMAWSGVRPHLPRPKAPPPLEQPIAVVIQALPQTPPEATQTTTEESTDDKAPAPRVVVVTPDSPAINFSVPTIGNVIVPNAVAAPPPAVPLRAAPAPVRHEPKPIGSTGEGGDRPQPPYPEMALKFGQQGMVRILLTVDDSGIVQTASIQETSGSPILDRSSLEFVKRHWIIPPQNGGHSFIATINYQIQ